MPLWVVCLQENQHTQGRERTGEKTLSGLVTGLVEIPQSGSSARSLLFCRWLDGWLGGRLVAIFLAAWTLSYEPQLQ